MGLPSGNFWEIARVDQGVHVWRPGGEHLDARKVRGLEPALNGRMRAVKAESCASGAGVLALQALAPPPTHLHRCGTLQQAQVRSSSPLAGSFRFDQLSARPFLFFHHLAECITPGDLVVWKRRKGTCWMGPNRDILIYKSLPFFFHSNIYSPQTTVL